MKIKSRKFKPNRAIQGNMYVRDNYQDFSGELNSMDFCQQNQSYSIYSRYKYTNTRYNTRSTGKRKFSLRPVSPKLGSEEYMMKKIEQTSATIMKQLLNPHEQFIETVNQTSVENKEECSTSVRTGNKTSESSSSSINSYNSGKTKKSAICKIDEIHQKIMNHITKLNDGKKKNLINSNMSGYDVIIEQIQKQKRLEISRALRAMCSQSKETKETSDFINCIIPDMGIDIKDLPHDLIEELRNTLNADSEWNSDNLFYNRESNGEVFSKTDDILIEDVLNNFDDSLSKNKPTEIHVKPELTYNSISCEEKKSINKISDDTVPNDSECPNDTFFNKSNNVTNINCTSENNNENSIISIKKEICEQPAAEPYSSTYEETKTDERNCITVNIKKEFCEDLEYKYDNYLHNISKDIEENVENVNNSPTFFVKMELCNDNEEKEYNTETIQNKIGQCQNRVKKDECVSKLNMSTQTEDECETFCPEKFIDRLLTKCYKEIPTNVSDAVSRMFEIDQCVLKLTNYRQSLFTKLNLAGIPSHFQTVINSAFPTNSKTECSAKDIAVICKKSKKEKKRSVSLSSIKEIETDVEQLAASNVFLGISPEKDCKAKYMSENITVVSKINKSTPKKCCLINKKTLNKNLVHLKLQNINEKILVIKVIEDKLVAASESGKIIFCNLENGQYTKILHASDVPITSLLFMKHNHQVTYMYVGSFENNLKIYRFDNYSMVETMLIDDSVQCMECNWGYIFIGCIGGSLLRYKVKKKVVEFEDKYSNDSILVLKATQEGARRVLLIGSRNSPVCIRDAMTGLYMRTMEDVVSPTVYSLILEKNLLYCGTTNHDILVYSFHDGKLIYRHEATSSKGIGCMKIYGNLLFASCHNGNIYVYDIKGNKFITSMEGPGGVILSMEIFENQVIVGTMSFKFISLPIPQHILQHKICN